MSGTPSGHDVGMLERYARAARKTGPKIISRTPGVLLSGYWLDENAYFFLREKIDPASGRVIEIPSVANPETGEVSEVDSSHPLRAGVEATSSVPSLYSPDGRYACFVRGYDLWLRELESGAERPLTQDGERHRAYGQQSETALCAVSYRKNPWPMGRWSPDSQWVLTHQIDERVVPEQSIVQHAPEGGGRPLLHTFKYAMPGDPLPMATYVAIHVASGRKVRFDVFAAPVILAFSPFAQLAWFGRPAEAWFLRFDRYFKQVELIRLDLQSGEGRVVLTDCVTTGYLNLRPIGVGTLNVRTLSSSEEIIWFSQRDGWGHLYLHDARTGALKNQVTRGPWLVRDIVHVDETNRRVLFLAGGVEKDKDPARRALCAVNLDGTGFEVLAAHDGDVSVPRTEPHGPSQDKLRSPLEGQAGISPQGRYAVVRYASVDRGNRTEIVDLRSRRGVTIAAAPPASDEVPPRHFSALASDGVTRLHGVLFFPSDFDASRRYPLIDYIYPGPQIPWQPQIFRVTSAEAAALAELGFIVMMLDTRGAPVSSRAFNQVGYGQLLEPQLSDHVSVVHELCEKSQFMDAARVGIFGASGGGLATARALFDYPDVFKVGVAVCGNHDSTYFTAQWSDTYRGPGSRAVWDAQASGATAAKLRGKLLLVSGDMDECVLVSQTLALADALVRANRDFDLLIVPNQGHAVLTRSGYAQRRMWDYFVRHLLGESPPENFELTFEDHEIAHFGNVYLRERYQL